MAETTGLLNRRTGKSRTEGSNPSVSASQSPVSESPNSIAAKRARFRAACAPKPYTEKRPSRRICPKLWRFLCAPFAWYGFARCWESSGRIVRTMPKSSPAPPRTRRKSALGLTCFPSLLKWEDPWEAGLDLNRLRGRKSQFCAIRTLAEDRARRYAASNIDRDGVAHLVAELEDGAEESNPEEGLHVDQDEVARFIAELELGTEEARQLADDAFLIWEWFLLPRLQARVGMGREWLLQQLQRSARSARELQALLEPTAVQVEDLLLAMPRELKVPEDSDLLELVRLLKEFARSAEQSVAYLKPAGRRPDARRNLALALATWAVEEATGEKVRTSRGKKSCTTPHFTRPPGKFVAQFLHLIGDWDERVLVGAFDKLRRPRSANKPR